MTTLKEQLIEMLEMRMEELADIGISFYEDIWWKWLMQNLAILQYMNEPYAPFLQ